MSGNQQVDLNQPVSINLPLGAWNTVLGLIAKGPWDMADPLMQVMRSQIQVATQPRAASPAVPTPRSAPLPPRRMSVEIPGDHQEVD